MEVAFTVHIPENEHYFSNYETHIEARRSFDEPVPFSVSKECTH